METFAEPKAMEENPDYEAQRKEALSRLSNAMIDAPIIEIVSGFNRLPYCYTLQSCYGHFLYGRRRNPLNLEPLPKTDTIVAVEYRIAYIALCIECSDRGKRFLEDLKRIVDIDPENIQICSAEWFWQKRVNSYALQVEPERFKSADKATLDYQEALKIERIRGQFFPGLHQLVQKHLGKQR